jgi:transposase-like protein
MNFGVLFQKKERLTAEEKSENSETMGDRWTFTAVLPESSYLHVVYSGQRNQEEATDFVEQIREHSNGSALFFESDGWFYEEVLTDVYSTLQEVPYKGRAQAIAYKSSTPSVKICTSRQRT